MLTTLMAKRDALMAKFSKVDVADIKDAELRAKAKKLKAKQGGFTLLELLVVVAILAAIAGTATIALSEAEKQTRAGLHASMMDGLTKALHTYPVLNNGKFPKYFDSMLNKGATNTSDSMPNTTATGTAVGTDTTIMPLASDKFGALAIDAAMATNLSGTGLDEVMAVDSTVANCTGAGSLASDLENGVRSINNLFRTSDAGGCAVAHTVIASDVLVAYTGKLQPLMGVNAATWDATTVTMSGGSYTANAAGAPVVVALGLGPSASLFDPNSVGGMTATPSYRGGDKIQYNRFIGLFKVGSVDGSQAITVADPQFLGVVSPAGTFVSEELADYQG